MAVDDSYTKCLVHFNGADGSTSLTDESGKAWTFYGNAQLDTAQYKFGTASGLFDGTGDYIDTPDHADFDMGTGDFTVDFWLKVNSITTAFLLNKRASSAGFGWQGVLLNAVTGILQWYASSNGTSWNVVNGKNFGTVSDTNWHHIALVRTGNTWKAFFDGTQGGGDTTDANALQNPAQTLKIGGDSDTNFLNGWVDEFRVSKGIARWTANFTPPTSEYTVAPKTVWYF